MDQEDTAMHEHSLTQERRWTVAKSNDIIRNSRYSLSVQQQKILLYMISKIRPMDTGNEEYTFDIQEFCSVAGLDTSNGFYYVSLKRQIKELRDSSVWVKVGKKEILLSWLNTVEMDEGSGTIKIKFHETIQPYLFELKEKYVSYRLNEVLVMRSKYSLHLYELLKSFAYGDAFHNYQEVEVNYEPKQLQVLLDAEKYDRYYNFKQRVLLPAIQEINECSEEIHVEMKEERAGRAIKSVLFLITHAHGRQILNAREMKKDKYSKRTRKKSNS